MLTEYFHHHVTSASRKTVLYQPQTGIVPTTAVFSWLLYFVWTILWALTWQ